MKLSTFYFHLDICARKHTVTLPNKDDCTRYWLCVGGKKYDTQCPGGLVYNSLIKSCDDRNSMTTLSSPCKERSSTTHEKNKDSMKRNRAALFKKLNLPNNYGAGTRR